MVGLYKRYMSNTLDTLETSIPLTIVDILHEDKVFHLIQDTELPAGTKQRGIKFFETLKDSGIKEVVTYGTVYGYGQVATAWCCREIGLLCTIFLPETFPRTHMTKDAIKLGATIIDVGPENGYPNGIILLTKSKIYAQKDETRRLIEIGLNDDGYIQALADGIVHGNNLLQTKIYPERIWVAGGSGVLTRAIAKAFPNAEVCVVQVGRRINPDILKEIKHTLYISPEPFRNNASLPPPYKSLAHYDAKIWRFVSKHGCTGDYIWNVK